MNRTLLALAVTAALAVPLTAQAAPTVYGLLNLSLDMVDQKDSSGLDEFQVNSNSSRLGVKGEEDLGNGYSAVYKAEWGVTGDVAQPAATASDLTGRDRYIGLKSSWGTVKLGSYDSPLKTSQGNVDVFNDMTYLDMASVTNIGSFNVVNMLGENRLDNSIGYESPKIADAITVKLTLQPGENSAALNGDDGLVDAISASVAYEQGGLYLAAAIDQGSDSAVVTASQLTTDTLRLTAVYTMDALQLGAMVQTSEASAGGGDQESLLLSAAYTAGKNVFKGQIIMNNTDVGGPSDFETLALAVGMDHNFTQMTKAFAQIGFSKTDLPGGADADENVISVGMQTKF